MVEITAVKAALPGSWDSLKFCKISRAWTLSGALRPRGVKVQVKAEFTRHTWLACQIRAALRGRFLPYSMLAGYPLPLSGPSLFPILVIPFFSPGHSHLTNSTSFTSPSLFTFSNTVFQCWNIFFFILPFLSHTCALRYHPQESFYRNSCQIKTAFSFRAALVWSELRSTN